MKKILIISPHYPPSNLAAVHRSRLFAQHLPSFGWEPVILTVHEKYYEELLDWNLHKLLPQDQRIEKVNAFPVTKPRIIGDIGLRAFFQLRKRALEIVRQEQIDFVLIPIPSFYVSLIGPYLHRKTGVKYGIDYIDPWVHQFPGSDKKFSRHWFSTKVAKWLEPKAVKKASLITGVAEGYYKGVLERNPVLKDNCMFGAMPYGGEKRDHELLNKTGVQPYLFSTDKSKIQLIYAGAFLPKSAEPFRHICKSILNNKDIFSNTVFHFIGTGKIQGGELMYTVKPIAEEFGLYNSIIKEHPARIPYLDVLVHLEYANGAFILGSTEPHYTPSKAYQAVLSKKAIMAVLHSNSTAVKAIRETNAGVVLDFNGEEDLQKIENCFANEFKKYLNFQASFQTTNVRLDIFEEYSAKSVTKKFSELLNTI